MYSYRDVNVDEFINELHERKRKRDNRISKKAGRICVYVLVGMLFLTVCFLMYLVYLRDGASAFYFNPSEYFSEYFKF